LQQLVAARDDLLTDGPTDRPTDRCGGSTVNIALALAVSLYQEPGQVSRCSSTKPIVLAHSNTKMLGVVVRCGDHELKHGQMLPGKVLYIPGNEKARI